MGKSDFKKINDHWHQDYDSRPALDKYYNETNEVSNGKSRRGASKSKRSNHKHSYEKVVLEYPHKTYAGLGRRCTICGKIRVDKWGVFFKTPEGYYNLATYLEVVEKYKDLPIVSYEE